MDKRASSEVSASGLGRPVTRLQFLSAMGAGGLALAGCGSSGGTSAKGSSSAKIAKGGEVNVLTWADYYAPSCLKDFTSSTGTTTHQAYFVSNDLMFSKLNSASGASFDVAIATDGWVKQLVARDALATVDKSLISTKDIASRFLHPVYDPTDSYSVPKDYGVFGVCYDPTVVKGEIQSWQDFLDAGARPGVSGLVAASNTPAETIGIGLWSLGYDWNTTNSDQIHKAGSVMADFNKHVRGYEFAPIKGMVSGEYVLSVMSHGDARNAMIQDKKLKFVVPKPQSERWVDTYVFPKGSSNVGQAHSFVSFMMQPKRQMENTVYMGYPGPAANLRALMPKSVQLPGAIFPTAEEFDRTVSQVINPSTQQLMEQLYNQIVGASS
jgi:spermidine/putrescine transport system substrate-binding protein